MQGPRPASCSVPSRLLPGLTVVGTICLQSQPKISPDPDPCCGRSLRRRCSWRRRPCSASSAAAEAVGGSGSTAVTACGQPGGRKCSARSRLSCLAAPSCAAATYKISANGRHLNYTSLLLTVRQPDCSAVHRIFVSILQHAQSCHPSCVQSALLKRSVRYEVITVTAKRMRF